LSGRQTVLITQTEAEQRLTSELAEKRHQVAGRETDAILLIDDTEEQVR